MASLNSSKAAAGWQLVTGIALGDSGVGTSDEFTWTHGRGQKAAAVIVVDSANKVPVLDATVAVTQSSTSIIKLDNAGGALTVDMLVLWAIPSDVEIRPTTGPLLITAGEAVAS